VLIGLAMLGGGFGAGVFGSLLGLGGGTLLVPLLTLGFGLPLRDAVGVSLVAVIVTSSASASVFLQRHAANLRLGMTLELFTAVGAIAGGVIAFAVDQRLLAGLFALLLAYVSLSMLFRGGSEAAPAGAAPAGAAPAGTTPAEGDRDAKGDRDAARGGDADAAGEPRRGWAGELIARLSGRDYRIRRLGIGFIGSLGAGVVSALLGIGGGLIKVPVMHLAMGVPLRVATATSNLMMGITASASAVIYLLRGGIDPYIAGPTAIGVFLGASLGSRVVHRIDLRILRLLFTVVLLYTAFQMLRRAFA
jgi:uncharacterized membrane protein YfcA